LQKCHQWNQHAPNSSNNTKCAAGLPSKRQLLRLKYVVCDLAIVLHILHETEPLPCISIAEKFTSRAALGRHWWPATCKSRVWMTRSFYTPTRPPDTTIRHGHRWHGCWCFEATDDASRMMIHIKILLLGSVFSKLTWRVWYSRGCGLHAGVLVSLLLRNLAVAMLKLSWTPANFQPTWP
jgi:hypothetical protein